MAAGPTNKPIRKVTVGVLAGAIVTVLVWILKKFANVDVRSEVAAALTTVLTFLISYLTPPAAYETTVTDASGRARSAIK